VTASWDAAARVGAFAHEGFRLTTGETALATPVLGAVVALAVVYAGARYADKREKRNATVAFRLRQLNELYAPVRLLLDENRRHKDRLAVGTTGEWHVLDHLQTVKADPDGRAVMEQILAVNKEISEILRRNAGLAVTPWQESFSQFQNHYATLKRTWEDDDAPAETDMKYFPGDFETHIRDGHKRLTDTLDKEFPL
jgi:hypothetical protein